MAADKQEAFHRKRFCSPERRNRNLEARAAPPRAQEKPTPVINLRQPGENPFGQARSSTADAGNGQDNGTAPASTQEHSAKSRWQFLRLRQLPSGSGQLAPDQPKSGTDTAQQARQKRPNQTKSYDSENESDHGMPEQQAKPTQDQGIFPEAKADIGIGSGENWPPTAFRPWPHALSTYGSAGSKAAITLTAGSACPGAGNR